MRYVGYPESCSRETADRQSAVSALIGEAIFCQKQ